MSHALTSEEIERVRRALRALVARYPSQAVLGRVLGVSQQTVSAVLCDAQLPGLRFARGLARALGIPMEALLSRSGELEQASPRAA